MEFEITYSGEGTKIVVGEYSVVVRDREESDALNAGIDLLINCVTGNLRNRILSQIMRDRREDAK